MKRLHLWFLALASLLALSSAPHASGQAFFRYDGVVQTRGGAPAAGATVAVCAEPANVTTSPCSSLLTLYTDNTGATACSGTLVPSPPTPSQPCSNPMTTDGLGNYHFYAPAGVYTIQFYGPSVATYVQYDVTVAGGGGGGGGSPGGNIGDLQLKAGSSAFGGSHLNDSSTYPNQLTQNQSGSFKGLSLQGPLPYADVTAFGAKGDGVTDDTAAIQAAINFVCGGFTGIGIDSGVTVFFPTGRYIVSQPQLPSTAPVFPFPTGCAPTLTSGPGSTFDQTFPPMSEGAEIEVQNLGTNPNAAPVFRYSSLEGNFYGGHIKGLNIQGYNQALVVIGSVPFHLENVNLASFITGQADNTPLKLTDTYWFYWSYGVSGAFGCAPANPGCASGVTPPILMTGETVSGQVANIGQLGIDHVIFFGGGLKYIQRVVIDGGYPINWSFTNDTMESPNTDFLTISQLGSIAGGWGVTGISMINDLMADSPDDTAAAINMNAADGFLTGVFMANVYAGNGGEGVAIRQTAGQVVTYALNNSCDECVQAVIDTNGNQVGDGSSQSFAGTLDVTSNPTREQLPWPGPYDYLQSQNIQNSFATNGPANRWFVAGSSVSSLGVDPQRGFLFNDGTTWGFQSAINGTNTGEIGLTYASILPPTSLSGIAAAGGTLPSGTYTAVVRATSTNCSNSQSAPSAVATGVVLSGGNGSITWTWTAPNPNFYIGTVGGYCLTRGIGANQGTNKYIFISGASTTSYLDTGTAMTGGTMSLSNDFTTPVWHYIGSHSAFFNFAPSGMTFSSIGITNGFCPAWVVSGSVAWLGPGAVCGGGGGGGSLTVGTTTISGGTTQYILFDNAGVLGEEPQSSFSIAASQVVSGTFVNARIPAPTTSALGGIQAASGVTANQFMTYVDIFGVQHTALVNFSNLNGSLSCTQTPALITDVTTSVGSCATTVVQVEGAAIPVSAPVIGTNSSKQLVASTAHNLATPKICLDSSGSGTTQVCNTTGTFAPAAGDTIIYKTTTTNTGDVTVNVNSSSAVHVRKWLASSVLAAGDLPLGVYVLLTYDGTYWEMYSIGNAPTGISGLTTGYLSMGLTASSIQNSLCDQAITTANTLTCTDTAGIAAPAFTTTGTNGGINGTEGTGGSLTAATGKDLLYPDNTNHCWHANLNNSDKGCAVNGGTSAVVANDLAQYAGTAPGQISDSGVAVSNLCAPGSFASQTDGATVTWAIASVKCANASLTFTVHSGSRTLNLTGLASGGSYVLELTQDATGGEGLTLGTGCTWKVSVPGSGYSGSTVTPQTGAGAIDVLAFTYDGTRCFANFN